MARTKEFDQDQALACAVVAFREHGFAGTSTDALLRAMGISRQSMYDTFGDKKQLYLAALHLYNETSVTQIIREMSAAKSPLRGIEAALLSFAKRSVKDGSLGCLGVSAVCEFGQSDEAVDAETRVLGNRLVKAFERRFADAQALGEVPADLDVSDAATFLATILSGMKVAARAGASVESLRVSARFALRGLR